MNSWFGVARWPLVLGIAGGAAVVGLCIILGRRPSAVVRERRRRLAVNAKGRMSDAVVDDMQADELYYSYSVRGVHYTAAQDVSAVREHLPSDVSRIIGPAIVKYDPANPMNSILVCEDWSGIRTADGAVEQSAGGEGGLR